MNRSILVIMTLFVLTGGIIVSAETTGGAANGKVAGSDMKVCECPKGALYIDKNRPCPPGCPESPGDSSMLRY